MVTGLEVKRTRDKGWGVFTTRRFEKGDLIECVRVIVINRNDVTLTATTSIIRHYLFTWDEDGDKIGLPTGYGPFYNHSYHPNAYHYRHLDLEEVHIHALCDIPEKEEITINYGGYPNCADPMWFVVKDP